MIKGKKSILILILILILTGTILWTVVRGMLPKKEVVVPETESPVVVKKLYDSTLPLIYTGNAEIKPVDEIPYTATSSGTITAIGFKNGDFANQGQLVVAIDNQQARSNQLSASSEYNVSRIEFEKMSILYEKRLITETDYLSAKNRFDSARANLSASNDAVGRTEIRANISGRIADMNLKRYQEVNIGQQLFTLVKEDEMEIEVGVPGNTINNVQVGSKAKVMVSEINKNFDAFVSEVSPAADEATRQFKVKIRIPNPERELKKGMYGLVDIDLGTKQGLIVPKSAIIIKGIDKIIYINNNGRAKSVKINIVNENDTDALVNGEGLAEGAQLVIDGQTTLQDNVKLKIVQ